ncbi:MAG: YihA family ribosome biogenesis GTP-binding protein [Alloprevotella sp.]|nr:YihA family ribosome biogenesis GTP-binding protein [Alloprevotella sp.]
MKIVTAEFQISNSQPQRCPATNLPEYAFIGRSNVGKSSLINMLTGRKALAKTSATPGKTLLINHFIVNGAWYIVDLPGYGYAKRSKAQQQQLRKLIEGYILTRRQLTNLFVLIDSRHDPQRIDLEFIHWLGESGVPFSLVFTKADKNSRTAVKRNVDKFLNTLRQEWEELPPYFITSSTAQTGRDELLEFIGSINKEVAEQQSL